MSFAAMIVHLTEAVNIMKEKNPKNVKRIQFQPQLQQAIEESIIFFDDFESGSPGWETKDLTSETHWHPDTFNAYSGKSWWCGIPEIPGYLDWWYQVLSSPTIDLTHAVPPITLSFMHFYRTEWDQSDSTHHSRYWDGGNVRLSTNSGSTFFVQNPVIGNYDTDSLMAFVGQACIQRTHPLHSFSST